MKIKKLEIGKELLTSLGNYSNMKVSHYVTVEIEDGERPDYDAIYDEINRNLAIENDNIDPSWIKRDELKGEWKLTVKIKKRKNGS